MRILAGDIGGTNSRLAVFQNGGDGLRLQTQHTYASEQYGDLSEVLSEFLGRCDGACEAVCLGLPGPVDADEAVQLTNLPWTIDHELLCQISGTNNVTIINDVQASAAGVAHLRDEELTWLHTAASDPHGARAVISVGTGLGVAGLDPSGHSFATEAGHTTFAPRSDFDLALYRSLRKRYHHVSWERVASGPALTKIHSHIAFGGVSALDASEIVGRSGSDDQCRRAVAQFCSYIGAVAGNIALTMMATGGVYLCGGVAPKVIDAVGVEPFLEAFLDKGRMRPLLERIPILLIRDENLALVGAAHTAMELAAPL